MNRVVNQPHVRALAKTMLLSASLHLVLLFAVALVRRDYELVNLFNILDIDLLFPGIQKGIVSFILSYIVIGIVYTLMLIRSKRE